MRTLLVLFVLVVCLAIAFASEEEEKKNDKACGPGDMNGRCMRCNACKKSNNFRKCQNPVYTKECTEEKNKGKWCCCYDVSKDMFPKKQCRKPKKPRKGKKGGKEVEKKEG